MFDEDFGNNPTLTLQRLKDATAAFCAGRDTQMPEWVMSRSKAPYYLIHLEPLNPTHRAIALILNQPMEPSRVDTFSIPLVDAQDINNAVDALNAAVLPSHRTIVEKESRGLDEVYWARLDKQSLLNTIFLPLRNKYTEITQQRQTELDKIIAADKPFDNSGGFLRNKDLINKAKMAAKSAANAASEAKHKLEFLAAGAQILNWQFSPTGSNPTPESMTAPVFWAEAPLYYLRGEPGENRLKFAEELADGIQTSVNDDLSRTQKSLDVITGWVNFTATATSPKRRAPVIIINEAALNRHIGEATYDGFTKNPDWVKFTNNLSWLKQETTLISWATAWGDAILRAAGDDARARVAAENVAEPKRGVLAAATSWFRPNA